MVSGSYVELVSSRPHLSSANEGLDYSVTLSDSLMMSQQTRSFGPAAKFKMVSGRHPTGGVLEVDLPPPGFIRSAGTRKYWWPMLWNWQKTDRFGDKSQRRDDTAERYASWWWWWWWWWWCHGLWPSSSFPSVDLMRWIWVTTLTACCRCLCRTQTRATTSTAWTLTRCRDMTPPTITGERWSWKGKIKNGNVITGKSIRKVCKFRRRSVYNAMW